MKFRSLGPMLVSILFVVACKDEPTAPLARSGISLAPKATVVVAPNIVPQIAAAAAHTCAVRSDGSVICWGSNVHGEITIPATLTAVSQMSLGIYHTCALETSGTVVCWGDNSLGQSSVPATLTSAIQVEAGDYHTCALQANGTVVCWGSNATGQTAVPGTLTAVSQVSAGGNHTCGLRTDGTIVCWGSDFDGQSTVPGTLGLVTQISTGTEFTCALMSDGAVDCWGVNTEQESTVPASVSDVAQISSGFQHSCGVKTDATVVCWGDDLMDQSTVPATLTPVMQVAAGGYHTCALQTSGTVVCWGFNSAGQTNVPVGLNLWVDATAPLISYNTAPPPNAAGWNNADVALTWMVSDPQSGISGWTGCADVMIATEGAGISQSCSATNNAGMTGFVTATVNLDKTPPTLTVPADFTVNATMPSGAVVSYAISVSDALSGLASTTCVRASGSTFPIGVNSTMCIATDNAGNSTSRTFAVTVLGAPEQIANLIGSIRSMSIPPGQKAKLIALLGQALAVPATSCQSLQLLILAVGAVPPAVISPADAASIIADATRIRAVLGCP